MIFINNKRIAKLAGAHYNAKTIQSTPIVYSRTHEVCEQFKTLSHYPSCVLVTSFSDDSVTDAMADLLPPNVRMWFSTNVATLHPRVVGMPIGMRLSIGIERILTKAINRGRPTQTSKLMYINFFRTIHRIPNPRFGLYERFQYEPWVTAEGGINHIPPDQFYCQIQSHPYVLSPPGAGPDCHRHWESMMLGSIPIVKRCPVTHILDGFPCLQVDDWNEVTLERLNASYRSLMRRFEKPIMEQMYFEYWQKRILEA